MGVMILGERMQRIPMEKWPVVALESDVLDVWQSRDYLAVLYQQKANGWKRLTVNSVRRKGGTWRDGITWDELQRIKNECLGEDVWCIENYPAQSKLVNVSNMRHLFVLDGMPDFRFPDERVVDLGFFEMKRS